MCFSGKIGKLTSYEMINLVNPEIVVLNQGYNCHLAKRVKKSLSVEMGHSRNFKSWYCNIKEMRANCN